MLVARCSHIKILYTCWTPHCFTLTVYLKPPDACHSLSLSCPFVGELTFSWSREWMQYFSWNVHQSEDERSQTASFMARETPLSSSSSSWVASRLSKEKDLSWLELQTLSREYLYFWFIISCLLFSFFLLNSLHLFITWESVRHLMCEGNSIELGWDWGDEGICRRILFLSSLLSMNYVYYCLVVEMRQTRLPFWSRVRHASCIIQLWLHWEDMLFFHDCFLTPYPNLMNNDGSVSSLISDTRFFVRNLFQVGEVLIRPRENIKQRIPSCNYGTGMQEVPYDNLLAHSIGFRVFSLSFLSLGDIPRNSLQSLFWTFIRVARNEKSRTKQKEIWKGEELMVGLKEGWKEVLFSDLEASGINFLSVFSTQCSSQSREEGRSTGLTVKTLRTLGRQISHAVEMNVEMDRDLDKERKEEEWTEETREGRVKRPNKNIK